MMAREGEMGRGEFRDPGLSTYWDAPTKTLCGRFEWGIFVSCVFDDDGKQSMAPSRPRVPVSLDNFGAPTQR